MLLIADLVLLISALMPGKAVSRFKGLPDVPDYGEQASYEDAVNALFDQKIQSVKPVKTGGGQVAAVFSVQTKGNRWFVKITREDCDSCDETHFENEWLLKQLSEQQQDHFSWLETVNAELVFPVKGGTFCHRGKIHLIASYPWVTGTELQKIYHDYFVQKNTSPLMEKAFTRYGEVLGLMHFDPAKPDRDVAKLLDRPVRLHLYDRNARNELYNEADGRFYMVDLADDAHFFGRTVSVKEDLDFWLESMFYDLAFPLAESTEYNPGENYHCLIQPIESFIKGYVSSLVAYDPKLLRKMIIARYLQAFRLTCEKEKHRLCSALTFLEKHYLKEKLS